MSANSTGFFEYDGSAGSASKDELFLERLDTFMEKCLADIKAFAERELQPYEETRRCIAQWHAKYLFQPPVGTPLSCTASTFADLASGRASQVRSILRDTSRILESLSETSGVESFLLAVDPHEPTDAGFLGGSLRGREFWRGMRGGGEGGARLFKSHLVNQLQTQQRVTAVVQTRDLERQVSTPPKGGPSRSIKTELYESVRSALRRASGIRNAEMKWTNPERLDAFGVRLVGWPEGVPAQNPSSLKVSQNKILLEAIQSGTMRFEKLSNAQNVGSGEVIEGRSPSRADGDGVDEDFSWAYDADAGSPPPQPTAQPAAVQPLLAATSQSLDNSNANRVSWSLDVPDNDRDLTVEYEWDGAFIEAMSTGEKEWNSDLQSPPERPRKRPRSEEPPEI
ncbi:unnamed protein product [Cyclocybe aegerita]|uniref:Uncharacterized protein n=1 Tax=Cyclocybe aegerita TaxID=1973307 RepID=A0A8S0VYJ6_CYCAE|nr:unnamed protein product [Cyclocybe aegerita]